MAVLEKIRVRFGLAASIIIAIGLLSFIIDPSEVINAFHAMSSKNDVGVINGKSVSYSDFMEENENMTRINEIMNGTLSQSAEQQEQVRNATWQDLIYRYLFVKNARLAGINIGNDEMVDLSTGSNPSPLVYQNPVFFDETGNFTRDNVVKFIQAIDSDETGRLRLYWDYLQKSILNQQYYAKYSSLFVEGNVLNPLMVRRALEENNNTSDVEFVMVPFVYDMDTTIVVSSKEITDYYKKHKEFYRQDESRDIEYVVFEVTPSASDIEKVRDEVAGLYEEFSTTDNMKNFLLKNSDRAYSEYWYKEGELRPVSVDIEKFIWGDDKSRVSDIFTVRQNTFFVAREMASRMIPDSVYVRHILLHGTDTEDLADSLVTVLKKGENFANLASVYSDDTGSAADGSQGNIGWMTQTYMIPGFESALTAKVGEPFILKTQYGTHIVEVTRRSEPVAKKQVAIFEKEALASKETINSFYSKANTFATLAAGGYDAYKKAVDSLGVYSHPVNKLLESSNKLGAIENTREITRWAFENKAGKVSDIKTIDNNYFFIVTVKNIHKEGYSTVNEVANQIRDELYNRKYAEKKTAGIKEKTEGLTDLESIAEALGTSVSTQSGVALSSLNSAYGMDPAFLGAVYSAKEGELTGPVQGTIGAYIFRVTGRDTGAFYTEEDARNRAVQMSGYLSQMIMPVMMQDAEVKDNRARFF